MHKKVLRDRVKHVTTLGGTEPHRSSWQCKESQRRCYHIPLAPLAMGNSGNPPYSPDTIITNDENTNKTNRTIRNPYTQLDYLKIRILNVGRKMSPNET